MSCFSSSSASCVEPLSFYSTSRSPYTPFGYHPNPDRNNNIIKDCFDFYSSSSFPSNQFLMHNTAIFNSSSPSSSSSSGELLDFNWSPMRRVFSTGDLQDINGLQSSLNETQSNETGTVACKVGRYSAEERKQRIERYRSKRQQRNFQKKITYACRKTLADSRPRVRGRFARYGETETEMEMESEMASTGHGNFGYNNYNCNVYRQSQNDCTGTRDWQEELSYEEVFWPNMVDIFSNNLLS